MSVGDVLKRARIFLHQTLGVVALQRQLLGEADRELSVLGVVVRTLSATARTKRKGRKKKLDSIGVVGDTL